MVSLEELFLPLLISISFALVMWLSLKLIIKNGNKSGIITSLFLILFFAYGHIFIYVKGIEILGFNTSTHIHFVIPFVIIFSIGVYFILRIKRKLDNATKISNAISITLVVMVTINITIFGVESFMMNENSESIIYSSNENKIDQYPDVYYIILDGYANSNTLTNEYDFDNQDFISYLENKNFIIPSQTHGNYPLTFLALSSSLNMKYLNEQKDQFDTRDKAQSTGHKLINDNEVMKNFKAKGYKIISFDSGSWLTNSIKIADWNLCGTNNLDSEFVGMIVRTTMLNPIHVRLLENDIREGILCIFDELPLLKERTDKPIFVFAHILIPHPPYIFGANGQSVETESLSLTEGWDDREGYTNQIHFANKKIKDLLNEMLSDDYSPVIIIQSDHGPRGSVDWENPDNVMIKRLYGILNAYHLPDDGNKEIYETISPINSFRIVSNYYLDQNYELLDDKAYFSNVNQPDRFDDVSSILQE
jgi:hypothetical protein